MTKNGFKPIGFSTRLIKAIQQRGAGENIIKNLAELIKNCDDAYDTLQQKNIGTNGIIEVGYWQFLQKKRRVINAYFVRDYGIGMTIQQAHDAFGEKSYGEDTSANTRNGAIGVGGKDAFYGMEDVFIISIHKGIPILIELRTNKDSIIEYQITENTSDVKSAIYEINKKISSYCNPIKLEQDGTFAMFKLPSHRTGLRFQTLHNTLRDYYTLRNITNGKNKTKLKLINVKTGEIHDLIYEEPESEIIQKPEPFQIAHTNKKGIQEHYQVDVLIKRAKDELDKDNNFGVNFLIETDQNGILDNDMFGSENDPAANKIFGNIIIHKWKSLFREDQGVLPENRESLLWSHSFNRQIQVRMRQLLTPIIDIERRKQGKTPEADTKLDKKIKSALAFLNKLIQEEEYEHEKDPKTPPELMEFSYARMKIIPGKTKSIKLYINPNIIPKLTPISTTVTEGENAGVTVEPTGIVKTPDDYQYPPHVPFIQFKVTAVKEGTDSHLKAYFADQQREVTISVVPEIELYPKDGFAFVPASAKFVRGKKKKLRVVIDTNMIKPGTVIQLHSEDERVKLPYSTISVSMPNMGKYLTEEFFEISCENSRIKTKIIAKTKTSKDEERETICKINVIEKDESKVFFKDYELDTAGDPRKRARFNDGIVYIHVNHPVLRHYFGNRQERVTSSPTKESVAMLADSILNIALRQWAKMRIEDGKVDILDMGRKDEEIDLEKDRLEFKYGEQIHRTLLAKFYA